MIELVISGGQTGADQAGWRAAKAAGIPTGGYMPRGFRTEAPDGRGWGERHPEFAAEFGAVEHESDEYPPRTRENVLASDGTLWFGSTTSRGHRSTHDAAVARLDRYPFYVAYPDRTRPSDVVAWIAEHRIRALNVAGNRGSSDPGLGPRVEEFLGRVFRILKEGGEQR